MTEHDFIQWLTGYIEGRGVLNPEEMKILAAKLKGVTPNILPVIYSDVKDYHPIPDNYGLNGGPFGPEEDRGVEA